MKKLNALLFFLLLSCSAFAQDYWKKVSSPGRSDLLSISFGSSSTGYIGGTDSTLLKTTDGGKTWAVLPHSGIAYEPLSRDVIDVRFVTATTGYAIVSNRRRPDINGVLYKTKDGGNTWKKEPGIWMSAYRGFFFDDKTGFVIGVSPFAGPTLMRLDHGIWSSVLYLGVGTAYLATAIDFLDASVGIVGGDYGYVYRTFDGGRSWDTVRTNIDTSINAIRYLDANTIVAASSDMMTLLISKDKGASWAFDGSSATFYYPEMKAMAISARDSLISVGRSRTTGKGLIYYFDAGGSWMKIAEAEQWLNDVTVRNDSIAYIVGDSGLILSNDISGVSVPETSVMQQSLRIYPNPSEGRFYVSLAEEHRIQVLDPNGKIVYRDERLSKEHQLDLNTLARGTYLLQVIPETGGTIRAKLQLR